MTRADTIQAIIDFEEGDLSPAEAHALFVHLKSSGLIVALAGHFGQDVFITIEHLAKSAVAR